MTSNTRTQTFILNSFLPGIFQFALIIGAIALPVHKTTSNIALAAAACLALLIFVIDRQIRYSLGVLPIIMFAFYSLSILYSVDKREGFKILELGISWLYIPLIFGLAGQYITERVRDRVLLYFALAVLMVCLVSYCRVILTTGNFLPSSEAASYNYYDPLSRYNFTEWIDFHPTYLAMYLLFAMAVFFERTNMHLLFKTLTLLLIAFFLIILSSKNQLIIFFPLAAILLWRSITMSTTWKIFIVAVIVATVLFVGLQSDQIKYRFQTELATGTGERTTFLAVGKSLFFENPIFGTGIGDGQHAIDQSLIEHNRKDLLDFNLHNQFLDYLVYFGLCGLLTFIGLLFVPILKRTDPLFSIFLLIVTAACMTEAILVRQKGLCFFVLIYGVLGSQYPLKMKSAPSGGD